LGEDNPLDEIRQLKSELRLKNKEINEYLDKIEYLENMIMEIEASLSEKSDKVDVPLLNIHIKDLERKNRKLKQKLSLLRLKNIKLNQKLEKIKRGYLSTYSLIHVVEDKETSNESEIPANNKIEEDNISAEELFKYIQIACPKCEIVKNLKIPTKILNKSQNITTIKIPKGLICEHSFQVFIDQFFKIRRYKVVDFEFQNIEYNKDVDIEDVQQKKDDLTYFTSLPFYKEIIKFINDSIDERDILGAAIFRINGVVIYASIPSNILINIIKEFEVRKENILQDMIKMFIELKNHQKFFSEYIKILNDEIIIGLIFSERVNFGMGIMIFEDLKKKIITLTKNYKDGAI